MDSYLDKRWLFSLYVYAHGGLLKDNAEGFRDSYCIPRLFVYGEKAGWC